MKNFDDLFAFVYRLHLKEGAGASTVWSISALVFIFAPSLYGSTSYLSHILNAGDDAKALLSTAKFSASGYFASFAVSAAIVYRCFYVRLSRDRDFAIAIDSQQRAGSGWIFFLAFYPAVLISVWISVKAPAFSIPVLALMIAYQLATSAKRLSL